MIITNIKRSYLEIFNTRINIESKRSSYEIYSILYLAY
jgi:hypothetical protein